MTGSTVKALEVGMSSGSQSSAAGVVSVPDTVDHRCTPCAGRTGLDRADARALFQRLDQVAPSPLCLQSPSYGQNPAYEQTNS